MSTPEYQYSGAGGASRPKVAEPTTAAGRALVAILTNEAKLHHGVDKLSDNDLADILAIEAEARAAALDEARAAVEAMDRDILHSVEYDAMQREIGWELGQDDALAAIDALREGAE